MRIGLFTIYREIRDRIVKGVGILILAPPILEKQVKNLHHFFIPLRIIEPQKDKYRVKNEPNAL
jgi:hypothetical protein